MLRTSSKTSKSLSNLMESKADFTSTLTKYSFGLMGNVSPGKAVNQPCQLTLFHDAATAFA